MPGQDDEILNPGAGDSSAFEADFRDAIGASESEPAESAAQAQETDDSIKGESEVGVNNDAGETQEEGESQQGAVADESTPETTATEETETAKPVEAARPTSAVATDAAAPDDFDAFAKQVDAEVAQTVEQARDAAREQVKPEAIRIANEYIELTAQLKALRDKTLVENEDGEKVHRALTFDETEQRDEIKAKRAALEAQGQKLKEYVESAGSDAKRAATDKANEKKAGAWVGTVCKLMPELQAVREFIPQVIQTNSLPRNEDGTVDGGTLLAICTHKYTVKYGKTPGEVKAQVKAETTAKQERITGLGKIAAGSTASSAPKPGSRTPSYLKNASDDMKRKVGKFDQYWNEASS